MRTPKEALAEILSRVQPLEEVEEVNLDLACGRVLAQDVHSDVDLPPFQKSAMDGFAVRSADFAGGGAEDGIRLRLAGESRAGHPYQGEVPEGSCIEIYTGAEVPEDTDAVVIIEKSIADGEAVRLMDRPRPGQNICNRGEDLRKGEVVLQARMRLSPADLSVLAAVGCVPVPVFRRPTVSVLTTGDELVPPSEVPARGQIREGNTLHLAALAQLGGADVRDVGVVPDDPEILADRFGAALESCDVVITTGGVSMGRYDLVAEAFEACGVREVFHKVAIKPGKPMWFGIRDRTLVFALPGNPVSCLLDHEVFVQPALSKLEGAESSEQEERLRIGRWNGGETRQNPRQQNIPVSVTQAEDGVDRLEPLKWSSSADIVGLSKAEGMVVVPPGEKVNRGDLVSFRPLFRRS